VAPRRTSATSADAVRASSAHLSQRSAAPTRSAQHSDKPGARWPRLGRRLADPWLLAALAITIGAFALREIGTGFGLPYHYHWDEPTIVNRAMRMGGGDLNPHFFYYPALSMYVTFVTEAGLYLVGHLLHVYSSVNAFAAAYFTDSTPFYLLGRTLGALLGAATVALCYLVGRRFFAAPAVAALGALLLAVAPAHVANAHFITNDVPMAFFVLLAYLWLWDVYARGRRRDYALAGIAIGLGIATKYLPAVLLVSLALAHALRIHRETGRWRPRGAELARLGLGVGVALAMFALASPYSILDWRAAVHDYIIQGQISSAAGADAPLNAIPYLTSELGWSIGWPAYLAALIGLAAIVRARGERRRQLLLFASFPLLYFMLIGTARQPWGRWLVALQPFLALGAAAVAWWCASQAPVLWRRLVPRVRIGRAVLVPVALAGLTLLLAVPPTVTAVRYDVYLAHPDPRTEATRWFTAHVPAGTVIAVQPLYQRYFLTAPIMTASQLAMLEQDIPGGKPAVRAAVEAYYRARPLYPDVPFVYNLAALRAAGVRYVVLSSASYHNDAGSATEDPFYQALRQQARVVARFAPTMDLPDADLYPVSMPTITIYALG
jgi:4-amino-4-deoxy-L-arabinose transferase-like glycosyltransferase